MTEKERILKLVEGLPDDSDGDDVMYALYVKDKIDRGLASAEAGRLIPHEEVKRRLSKWLAK